MRNVRNILRHEFIGLPCDVVAAQNKDLIGISGTVRDETLKTMVIDGKRVPKQGTTFRLRLEKATVRIDGSAIAARPEDRIKKKFKKW